MVIFPEGSNNDLNASLGTVCVSRTEFQVGGGPKHQFPLPETWEHNLGPLSHLEEVRLEVVGLLHGLQ